MLLFSKNLFSIHIVFKYQLKIIRVIELRKKRINFLLIAVIYFPLSIYMNILTLCILYLLLNFSDVYCICLKNLLLLPRILKLIEDIVDDSTPLLILEE